MTKNTNPVFSTIETGTTHYADTDAATYKGIFLKTGLFTLITVAVALLVAYYLPVILDNNPTGLYVTLGISGMIGFFSVMFGRFSARGAKYAGVIYGVCQGIALGTVSAICEAYFPGIAMLAILSTIALFAVMLILYTTGILRNCSFIRKLAYGMSFGAIALLLVSSLLGLFVSTLFNNMGLLIGLEAFFLIYGVITLIFNFDEAYMVVESGCTKDAEWNVSLGLLVSIVYIYVEVLRILMLILANNDNS